MKGDDDGDCDYNYDCVGDPGLARARMIVRALPAMEHATTRERFRAASGVAGSGSSRSAADSLLDYVLSKGIGTEGKGGGNDNSDGDDTSLSFSGRDRLRAAALALEAGCDIEQVSQGLSWKDFEGLATEVLSSLGFATRANVRFTKPRMEIDVLGIQAGFALAVDCKHWKRGNLSSISRFCEKQAVRAERLVGGDSSISVAVPAILTLHAESTRFVGGIPVVPVWQFRSFAMDARGYLGEMRAIVRQGSAAR
ncbi:hypothetical protein [Nitrososphaera sp.]|uniref:hypothetical protein n=1 Tax=Nitrososphaera sp. TaxID=1971748 RepID=UPI00307FB08B